MKTITSAIAGIGYALAYVSTAYAGSPAGTAFTYQGQLKQGGVPVNGTIDLEFTLWDAEADGNPVGSPVGINGVAVSNGLFTADLDFGASAFGGDDRWLQVAVNGTTLGSRQRVASTPYAQFAAAPWAKSGVSDLSYLEGNVGIGTTTPQDRLHVTDGSLLLGVNSNLMKQDSGGVVRSLLLYDGSDNLQFLAPPDKTMAFRTGTGGFTSVRATLTATGRLGIGTATPDVLLHLQSGTPGDSGTITASNVLLERNSDNYLTFMSPSNRASGLAFGQPGNTNFELFHGAIVYNESTLLHAMQFRTGGNVTRMTIDGRGFVGIGTTTPRGALDVAGSADTTLRVERTGGAAVETTASATAGQIGTANNSNFRLLTNNLTRVMITGTGLVGINTGVPTGRLHVFDTTGGNASVVLPNSAIGAAEILDEPGCAGLVFAVDPFDDDPPLPAFFPDPPASLLSQSINAPAAGYVLAIATIGARSFSTGGTASRWGLTTDVANIPDDQMLLVEFNPTSTAGNWSTPVTLHRLFPVTAGTTTVHVVAQGFFGNWEYEKAQFSLIFIPTTYGTAPMTAGDNSQSAAAGFDGGEVSAVQSRPTDLAALLEQVQAERAALHAELESLAKLKADLEALRNVLPGRE